jgi:hypothetical protein
MSKLAGKGVRMVCADVGPDVAAVYGGEAAQA